jgi:intein/homing endonuclease
VIRTTHEHPFYVEGRGWLQAAALSPGDLLQSHDGQRLPVESLVEANQDVPVYNLRIADYHTYFVGSAEWGFSVWTHNMCVNAGAAGEQPTSAADAAMAEANIAQAEGMRGAASALETDAGVFTGKSTGAGGGPLYPDVQAAYDSVPPELQSPFHGNCAEGRAISAALEAGADPTGGTIVTVTIGGPKHGMIKAPCTSCAWILNLFGIGG